MLANGVVRVLRQAAARIPCWAGGGNPFREGCYASHIGDNANQIGNNASCIGGDAGVMVAGVTGDGSHGGGDVGVDSHGREDSYVVGSVNSEIGGGSEDDLLGGEVRKGGHGDGGEL